MNYKEIFKNLKGSVRIKGREVPLTQIYSWRLIQLTDRVIHEKEKLLAALKEFGPMSSRQLSRITGIERSSINRTVKNLENEGVIKVHYIDKCATTGKPVRHYWFVIEEPIQKTLF